MEGVTTNAPPVKSLGEQRVRTEFNPANSDTVSQIKQKTAELINLVSHLEKDGACPPEMARVKALAMTGYEEAGHWAVKAATY